MARNTDQLLANARMVQMLLTQHIKQKKFCASQKKIRVFFGGNRTGKTRGGAQELVRYVFGIHEHRKVVAPIEVWCCCPSYDVQLDTTQKIIQEIIPSHRIKDITYAKKNVWGRVELDNGSIITFKSYEMGREKFQGAGKRLIWFDEEPPRDIWEECFVRVDAAVPLDIIMTMTPVNGMCFDEETEVLAENGWKDIKSLNVGERIYTTNRETLETELKEVDYIYRGKMREDQKMIEVYSKTFSSATTNDHRWFIEERKSGKKRVATTETLNTNHKIRAAAYLPTNVASEIENWYVELVGWVVTDGTYKRTDSVIVYQSDTKNHEKCEKIRSILQRSGAEFGETISVYHKGETCEGRFIQFRIKGQLAKRIMCEFPTKELTVEFVSQLNHNQKLLLYGSLIDGDGSRNKNGHRFIAEQKYKGTVDALQALCFLIGKKSSVTEEGKYLRVHIQDGKRSPYIGSFRKKEVEYTGNVWCPHTTNETVIARRHGDAYISMNTWVYNEIYLNTTNSDLDVITATWEDNPWLTDEEKDRMTRGLTTDALVVRREGKFIQRQGLVCNWFNRSVHLVNGMIREQGWNIYRIVDFGWSSSKTCVLWFGIDSYDRVHLFDGLYVNETDDEALAKLIKEREYGFRVVRSWADNQPDRINTLKRNGIYCEPVAKTSMGGNWDSFRAESMYKIGSVNPASGRPMFFVSSTLVMEDTETRQDINWFVREIESLRWKERRNEAGFISTPEWSKENCPIKGAHFDAMDAFSYFCVMFSKRSTAYIESLGRYEDDEDKPKKKRRIVNPTTGF